MTSTTDHTKPKEPTMHPDYVVARDDRILRFRLEQDPRAEEVLALEAELRAELLRRPRAVNPAGQDYATVLGRVRSTTGGYLEDQLEQLARRIHRTGEGTWHAAWVLFGGRNGCSCAPCMLFGPRKLGLDGFDLDAWLAALGPLVDASAEARAAHIAMLRDVADRGLAKARR